MMHEPVSLHYNAFAYSPQLQRTIKLQYGLNNGLPARCKELSNGSIIQVWEAQGPTTVYCKLPMALLSVNLALHVCRNYLGV